MSETPEGPQNPVEQLTSGIDMRFVIGIGNNREPVTGLYVADEDRFNIPMQINFRDLAKNVTGVSNFSCGGFCVRSENKLAMVEPIGVDRPSQIPPATQEQFDAAQGKGITVVPKP